MHGIADVDAQRVGEKHSESRAHVDVFGGDQHCIGPVLLLVIIVGVGGAAKPNENAGARSQENDQRTLDQA